MNKEQRWFVIVNPTAGVNRAGKRWPKISEMLTQAGLEHDHGFTQRRGHGAVMARNAIREGYRKIITIGGDGTNNEVMNGVLKQKVVPSNEITYSIIPVGTGNDWIKTHKIPKNTKKVIALIKAGKTSYQDIGLVTYDEEGTEKKRYFMNVAGMSYDAFVAKVSHERRNFVTNQLFYFYLIFSCLWKFVPRKARIIYDGKVVEDEFYTINIGICRYSGGGMQFVPHAVPDDGLFALTMAQNMPKWRVITATPRFYTGNIESHPKVSVAQVKSIKVEDMGGKPTLVEVDGEFLGGTPVEFSILEKALKIIVP